MGEHKDSSPEAARGTGERPLAWLDKLLLVLAIAAVALHPTQITVRQWADLAATALGFGASLAARIPAVNVTVSDALLLGVCPLWLLVHWRRGTLLERLHAYPLALLAVLVAAILSVHASLKPSTLRMTADYGRAAKELIQLALFFVCSYMVLADYLSRARCRGRILAAFLAAVAVAVLVGVVEYAQLRPPSAQASQAGAITSVMDVDATFGFRGEAAGAHEKIGTSSNRNVLSAWVTLALPLLWAIFLFGRRMEVRIGALVLSAAGGLLLLQAGLWAAALLAILALSFMRGRLQFALTAGGILVFYTLVFSFCPQRQGLVLLDSVMLHTEADSFRTLPLYEIDPALDASGNGADLTEPRFSPWQQKYIEWQPALIAAASSPLFGVGLGNYQMAVNQFYTPREWPQYRMPVKAVANLMEKSANPFLAVWLAETGFLGLLAFAWLMFTFLRSGAAGAASEQATDRQDSAVWNAVGGTKALKAGACAALGAAALGCLFTNYWVRGVGTAFVLVLALCTMTSPRDGED